MAIQIFTPQNLPAAPTPPSKDSSSTMDTRAQNPVRKTEGGKYGDSDAEHNANLGPELLSGGE